MQRQTCRDKHAESPLYRKSLQTCLKSRVPVVNHAARSSAERCLIWARRTPFQNKAAGNTIIRTIPSSHGSSLHTMNPSLDFTSFNSLSSCRVRLALCGNCYPHSCAGPCFLPANCLLCLPPQIATGVTFCRISARCTMEHPPTTTATTEVCSPCPISFVIASSDSKVIYRFSFINRPQTRCHELRGAKQQLQSPCELHTTLIRQKRTPRVL